MDQGQQKLNADQRLVVWTQRIPESRSSGTGVKRRYRENGVSGKACYHHESMQCSCGKVAVDNGHDNLHRSYSGSRDDYNSSVEDAKEKACKLRNPVWLGVPECFAGMAANNQGGY